VQNDVSPAMCVCDWFRSLCLIAQSLVVEASHAKGGVPQTHTAAGPFFLDRLFYCPRRHEPGAGGAPKFGG